MSTSNVLFPPLTDAEGHTYRWLPCQAWPTFWDVDASYVEQAVAVQECRRRCPGLEACLQRALELEAKAAGVWGGWVFTPPASLDEEDQQVQIWAAAAGVPLPSGRNDA